MHGALVLYKASAPGSLLLLGEYAVLHGKMAVVCAIDKRIIVTIEPRRDNRIHIHSSLGTWSGLLEDLVRQPPLDFVLEALVSKKQALLSGCHIHIEAEFSSDIGLGSSAAVTVALMSALNQWLSQEPVTKEQLWQQVKAVISLVQGNGSGADIAASIYGGVIAFRSAPFYIASLQNHPPLCAVYSGKKTTTAKAIEIVRQRYTQNPQHFDRLFEHLDTISQQGVDAIHREDWESLGRLFTEAQEQMNQLGVTDTALSDIIQTLHQQPTIFGAKISGSGLGDCAIGLGFLEKALFPINEQQKNMGVRHIPVAVSAAGVMMGEY